LEAAPPATRNSFAADLRDALAVADEANTPKTDAGRDKIFGLWTSFCQSVTVRPDLSDMQGQETKLTYIMVFGLRYQREGQKNKSVTAGTVTDTILAVGKGIADLGQPDPRKQVQGEKRNHPLLAAFLRGLAKSDDPTKRSYPANITIIENLYHVLDTNHPVKGQANQHVINLTIAAYYWLLRPAEYTDSRDAGRSQAFHFRDVFFSIAMPNAPDKMVNATDRSLNDVEESRVRIATLTFTDQKNCVRGEKISQRATDNPDLCPCISIFRITQHLREHNAPPATRLCDYYDSHGNLSSIKPGFITNGLRWSARHLKQYTGIDPFLLSARSLRPGGATALLCANIDSDVIMLLGRWKSNAMFRYLRVQALAHSVNLAQKMLDHGKYTFAPSVYTKLADMPLPRETPVAFAEVLNHLEIED